jgi:menaquinone-dependent protoporphyrinogen oxidase
MKLSIIYATTEGHTRTIAEFLRNEAEKKGYTTALFDATVEPPSPEGYDLAVIAASVHAGKFQTSIEHYVRDHHKTLNAGKSIFLPVSLTAATDEPETWKELNQQTEDFLIATGWSPTLIEHTAGALLYTKYDFFKRMLMRVISKRSGGDTDSSKDFIYTDWDKLKELVGKFEKFPNSEVAHQ